MLDRKQQRARLRRPATGDTVNEHPSAIQPATDRVKPSNNEHCNQCGAAINAAEGIASLRLRPQDAAAQAMAAKRLAYVKGLLAPYRLSPLH